jgi:hypothetical protein
LWIHKKEKKEKRKKIKNKIPRGLLTFFAGT